MTDWKGNTRSYSATSGFANFREEDRQEHDFYATDPIALEKLLEREMFEHVWEPACGLGHLSGVMKKHGILERESDLYKRYEHEVADFLLESGLWDGDIVTNPPYKYATQFVRTAMRLITDGRRVAMIFPQRYLSSKERYKLFTELPPQYVYAFSGRVGCAMNGDFKSHSNNAVDYCWIIWKKGHIGETILRWIL